MFALGRHKMNKRILRSLLIAASIFTFSVLLTSDHHGWPFDLPDLLVFSFASTGYSIPTDPPGAWANHPVALLHERAKDSFNDLIQRQSRTAKDASIEYKRRYRCDPPPGFNEWAQHAIQLGSPIIDDFDILSHSVHRFAHLTAADIRRRMEDAAQGNSRVERCELRDNNGRKEFDEGCRHFARPLTALLDSAGARHLVPNLDFLINFLDEPSVLVTQEANSSSQNDPVLPWVDLSHSPISAVVNSACSLVDGSAFPTTDSITSRLETDITVEVPLVQDVTKAKDLCQNPNYISTQGLLMSPPTFKHMGSLVPILSQAAPAPFADILYPATHYSLRTSLYNGWWDRRWNKKKNAVYWAGSSTGGQWSDEDWMQGHRQRLAMFGVDQGYAGREFVYLRQAPLTNGGINSNGELQSYHAGAPDISVYDVSLTKIVGCASESACDAQRRFFGLPTDGSKSPTLHSESRPFRYKFVLDVDGNSYSGRFYRLLASHSCPLKASIFREWHDDRLVPWLHYVPVGSPPDELPELVRFLTETEDGQEIGHAIAEAGREWYDRSMTPMHQGLYIYRLMLEMAWLLDERRSPIQSA
ncbi:hypothetical protein MCOR25_003860 [Pyricularia grisea]|uniref:Glycosyl transferase CAP10 domain-containing protein n=1 Tax=Pyricularia grisea TaxID=148305 RepID=A0A6P8B9B9_PYRGI|nr:uncharacterized protein PgNI_03626 [Pyricularia grisea]KAI6371831.1 hypothetical protein MCOR25_003860 [Pyricularia grisea]TLD12247.1 hypothetical protein PgNI_03626 [Pyricularia grisea]